jgi:hypothetical protein
MIKRETSVAVSDLHSVSERIKRLAISIDGKPVESTNSAGRSSYTSSNDSHDSNMAAFNESHKAQEHTQPEFNYTYVPCHIRSTVNLLCCRHVCIFRPYNLAALSQVSYTFDPYALVSSPQLKSRVIGNLTKVNRVDCCSRGSQRASSRCQDWRFGMKGAGGRG